MTASASTATASAQAGVSLDWRGRCVGSSTHSGTSPVVPSGAAGIGRTTWSGPASSRSVAMELVGHRTEAVYRRYAIVAESDLREAARKLDATAGTIFGHSRACSDPSGTVSPRLHGEREWRNWQTHET